MISARWLDIGLVPPIELHATYAGLAEAQARYASPILVWGRATPHICLGQHQSGNVELVPSPTVPVIQRPLGGGTVWIDEHQYCFILIVPLGHVTTRPSEWFEWILAPARQTYQRFGLEVGRKDRDLWLSGRKIAGTGAATIGNCGVIASSFLMRFPGVQFADCVACPSHGFREWLGEGLDDAMTDWAAADSTPGEAELAQVFRATLESHHGWCFASSGLLGEERKAVQTATVELEAQDVEFKSRRLVPNGIKLNADTFLTEQHRDGQWVRLLTTGGKFKRIAVSEAWPAQVLDELQACAPTRNAVEGCLAGVLAWEHARYWAEFILGTAYFGENG
jgi:lipoate-protein ligase A